MELDDIRDFISKCIRVLKITKKPSKKEYKLTARVVALGVIIIGSVGFAISLLVQVIQMLAG